MNEAMKIVREINIEAELFYGEAQKLGKHAADALTGKRRSQMTGLENVAENALKTSDIFDYIKRQIARSAEGKDWRAPEKKAIEQPAAQAEQEEQQGFGARLKTYLEKDMEHRRDRVCGRINIAGANDRPTRTKSKEDDQAQRAKLQADRWKRQDIHLRLMRQFIRQMVIQYEYVSGALSEEQEEE